MSESFLVGKTNYSFKNSIKMGSVSGGFPCAVHADAETGEIRR